VDVDEDEDEDKNDNVVGIVDVNAGFITLTLCLLLDFSAKPTNSLTLDL